MDWTQGWLTTSRLNRLLIVDKYRSIDGEALVRVKISWNEWFDAARSPRSGVPRREPNVEAGQGTLNGHLRVLQIAEPESASLVTPAGDVGVTHPSGPGVPGQSLAGLDEKTAEWFEQRTLPDGIHYGIAVTGQFPLGGGAVLHCVRHLKWRRREVLDVQETFPRV